MNEGLKTVLYLAAALTACIVAIATNPRPSLPKIDIHVGKNLFDDFGDAGQARSLKIVRFDEKEGKPTEFEVAKVSGRWAIPSKENYPADAEAQLREAATCLIDLRVVEAFDSTIDHAAHGLVDPSNSSTKSEEAFGIHVSMKGAGDKTLAELIISNKKVPKGEANERYVRKPGEDRIYIVKINADKLSTKFSEWIEKDLLKLDAFNVEQLVLKDYSVNQVATPQGRAYAMGKRFELTASQEPTGPGWKLDKLTTFRGSQANPTALRDDEELHKEKLDDMKSALDNLQIVDVHRKPKGMSADLRADEKLMRDEAAVDSLVERGFLPLRIERTGPAEIYAANGEISVLMKDGVEYVLRFGHSAGAEEGAGATKLNRFLLVTTRVNEGKFPEPVLEPLPEEPADEAPAPAEEAKDENKEKEADADKAKDDAQKAADRKKAEVKAQRDRIAKDNKRKQDEYKANRKKAEDKVKELNLRFADWYYVISEDVYKKVHLGRVDLIRERTGPKDEGYGVDAFRKLEQGGLKKEAEKKGGLDLPGLPSFPGQK